MSIKKLQDMGFEKAGRWVSNNGKIEFTLEKLGDHENVLYAFVVGTAIKYIGKSTGTLHKRMQQYKTPDPSQTTNTNNNKYIKEELDAGNSVAIYAFADAGMLSYGGFRVNLAEGLETSMVKSIQPDWNEK